MRWHRHIAIVTELVHHSRTRTGVSATTLNVGIAVDVASMFALDFETLSFDAKRMQRFSPTEAISGG